MKRILLITSVLLFTGIGSYAQTSVYVCSQTGAYGYCYGNASASQCAYNNCIRYGGKSPYAVVSVASKGYGAIALGTNASGTRVVGAAAGYDNLEDAKNRARRECQNYGGSDIYIAETFQDY